MVVGFTTTCAICAYHHWRCEFESCSWQGIFDKTLCDQVCKWLAAGLWFSPGTPVSSNNKTNHHYITDIFESGVKYHRPNSILILVLNHFPCPHKYIPDCKFRIPAYAEANTCHNMQAWQNIKKNHILLVWRIVNNIA
jgi:hypothetical protein